MSIATQFCAGTATVPATADPALSVAKSHTVAGDYSLGNVVTYTITATNSGNVTLSGVQVGDDQTAFTGSGTLTPVGTRAPATLAPGATVSCTYSYPISQADVDAQTAVVNTAIASGVDPKGVAVAATPTTDQWTPVAADPGLALSITYTPPTDGSWDLLDVVSLSFELTNTAPAVASTSL